MLLSVLIVGSSNTLASMTAPVVAGATPVTLAGIACGDSGTRLYCPISVFDSCVRHEQRELGVQPLNRVKSMTRQFVCLTRSEEDIATHICLASTVRLIRVYAPDRSVFLVPESFFRFLGKVNLNQALRLRVDRASLRSFVHMMIILEPVITTAPDSVETIVRNYLHTPINGRPQDLRRIQRVLWALEPLAPWVERAVTLMRPEDSDDETLSVDSDSSSVGDDSSSAFSEGPGSVMVNGAVIRKESLLGKVRRLGREQFRQQFSIIGGEIDFTFQQLTTVENFSDVMRQIYTHQELLSVRLLNLSHNTISTIPADAFECLPQLQHLLLNDNPIRTVDVHALRGIPHLIQLSLVNATDIIIPQTVLEHVPQLQVLCLNNCQLTSIPLLHFVLHLRVLDVSDNLLLLMPDASMLGNLQTYNVMGNVINTLDLTRLPRTAEGKINLLILQLSDNNIAEIPSFFYDAVPTDHEMNISLHNNPVWEGLHAPVVAEELATQGFLQLSSAAREHGVLIAGEISRELFTDMCRKVGQFLNSRHQVPLVLSDEVHRARPVEAIYSFLPDCGMWIYRNKWLVSAGLILISGGVGAGIGVAARMLGSVVLRRAAIGAITGAVAGGVLAYLGIEYVIRDGQIYVNFGAESVLMTSGMRDKYIGMARIVALLSLLKQYIIATNSCLDWLLHYDEYAANPQRVHYIMTRLEQSMHLATQRLFARIDDPTTLAMLHTLLAANPLVELRKHVAHDILPPGSLEHMDFTAGADIAWFGAHRLDALRNVIVRMAGVARTARTLIMRRYWGDVDHANLCRIIAEAEPIGESLNEIIVDVLGPLIHYLGAHHPHDSLIQELGHIRDVATASSEILHTFANHRGFLMSLL
jgi:hypothetical protein